MSTNNIRDLFRIYLEEIGFGNTNESSFESLLEKFSHMAGELNYMAQLFAIHAGRNTPTAPDKDLAIKIYLRKHPERSQDIQLKLIMDKLDQIIDNTELIKEYTEPIDKILDRIDNLEAYLKDQLASDWDKIKDVYKKYKNKDISLKDFIKQGIKILGKKFIKKILDKFV